jgi:transposase
MDRGSNAVKALRAKGYGIRKVAAELGIGVSTVQRIDAGG